MRELRKHNYTGYNKCKDEQRQGELQRSDSGVMFDDDFVDALAQRLVQHMRDDLSGHAQTHYSETSAVTLRLLLAVLSVLAFVAVTAIVLKTDSLDRWMMLAILGMAGMIFVLINIAFQLPRRW
jgi:hypothetical protein